VDSMLTAKRLIFAVLILLLANGILLNRSKQHLSQNFHWVVHTLQVQAAIHQVQVDVIDFNRSVRMNWMAQRPSATRLSLIATWQRDTDRIQQLTIDNPSQQRRVEELRELLSEHAAIQAGTPSGPASMAPREDRLDQSAQRVMAHLDEMEAEESRLLQQRQNQILLTEKRINAGLVAGTAGVALLAVFLFFHYSHAMKREKNREIQLRLVINQLRDYSIVTLDSSGKIVDYSSSTGTITGHAREDLVGVDHSVFYAAADAASGLPQAALEEARRTGRAEQEVLQTRRDGTTYWAEVLVYPVLERGVRRGFSRVSRDISERRALRTALKENADIIERMNMDTRSRLAAIVESSEDAIIGKDLQGVVTSWNTGASRIFGYTPAEMVGQSVKILLPPDREHEEDEILSRIKLGETVAQFETVCRRNDGALIDVSLTTSPIKDIDGKVVGASRIASDITEKKHLARQLLQSQKMDAIGQLTGGIAHDFNNLLGIILGNLDLLEGFSSTNETALDQVRTAQRAAGRGADLTRRLLAFARMDGLKPAPTSLNSSIQNMIAMASRALGPEIKITTKFDASLPHVFVDAAGLESALLNLVVNARDAIPKGGTIAISTGLVNLGDSYGPVELGELKAGWYACASVSDTGQGMSQETLERAFEPFFTTKPRDKGTGLGLAMVYGFVKQSGGIARIYSELGVGTNVSMYLPLVEAGLEQQTVTPEEHSPAKLDCTVLMVDDEADLLKIAVAYLAEMGCNALKATDGASALEIVKRERKIDLMVTDIIMPSGMTGVDLAQRVSELNPEIKVIYSSGFPADVLAERRMSPMDGPLLRKPYQRAEFRAVIRRVLEGNNTKLN
jgi:PAS domain S-box-containing protein